MSQHRDINSKREMADAGLSKSFAHRLEQLAGSRDEILQGAELTALGRDEHVAEWIKLSDASQLGTHRKAGQQPGGVNAAARELGISKNDAHRAVKIGTITEHVKQSAREHGIDDSLAALLRVAR